jgi:coenzyme PQQ precursor peptide PqqA
MQWTKPMFEEISLSGEVTAYVNTDESRKPEEHLAEMQRVHPASEALAETSV